MKNTKNIIAIFTVIFCTALASSQDTSILEKVANAHGLQNWKNVEEIKFTFNVDRDTTHFERTWIWKPKTSDIGLAMRSARFES